MEVPADVCMTVPLITRDFEGLHGDYQDLLCCFKETVSWVALVLQEPQYSSSRGMTQTSSLSTVEAQAHFTVKVLGEGSLFSDSW